MLPNADAVYQWLWNADPPPFYGMGFIMADLGEGHLEPVGTGFITQARDSNALFVTAAHNIEWVLQRQNPNPRSHRTTPVDFAQPAPPLDLDPRKLRVSCVEGERVEMAIVSGVIYDGHLDFAILQLRIQETSEKNFFQHEFLFDGTPAQVGEEIALMGYAGMAIVEREVLGPASGSMAIRITRTLRRGRVTGHFEHGQRLCKGPCIETSIPVYPGMSGGPVFRLPAREGDGLKVLGLICSDPFASENERDDTTIPGSSLAALLPVQVEPLPDGKRSNVLTIPKGIGIGTFVAQRMTFGPKL